jgi:exosortase
MPVASTIADHAAPSPAVSSRRAWVAAVVVLSLVLGVAYWDIAVGLWRQWETDANYSHGVLVVPLAAYFAWRRRSAILDARPDAAGLLVICVSLLLYVVGRAAELFLARLSFVGIVAGCVLYLHGTRTLRVMAFPLAFLLLMIPLPAVVFNQITLPLQLFASHVGAIWLRAAGIPVLRDGNVLELANLRLEVVEACSGIRSLVSLAAFALVLGEWNGYRPWRTAVLTLATVPVAVFANAGRVALTGVASQVWGPAAAEGLLHTVSGALLFVIAVAALLAFDRLGGRVASRVRVQAS